MSEYTLYNMDVLDALKLMEPASVDCIVTSPPYWGLRDYGTGSWKGGHPDCEHKPANNPGPNASVGNTKKKIGRQPFRDVCGICGAVREDLQIGLEPHPRDWIAKMVEVSRGLKLVLKPGGSYWLNVGDTYCGSASGSSRDETAVGGGTNKLKEFKKQGRISQPKFKDLWLQPKQKMLMPHRLAIALQDDGWILRNDIVWHKPSHMPCSVRDRLTNSFEFVFHFVKARKYFYDLDAIREKHKTEFMPFNLRVREAKVGRLEKKFGNQYSATDEEKLQYDTDGVRIEYKGKRASSEYQSAVKAWNPGGKNPGDFWAINPKPYPEAHFACFPPALVEKPLKATCPKDGIVLDPFVGSGTTLLVAQKLGLNGIGIELNPDYIPLIKKRLLGHENQTSLNPNKVTVVDKNG